MFDDWVLEDMVKILEVLVEIEKLDIDQGIVHGRTNDMQVDGFLQCPDVQDSGFRSKTHTRSRAS